MSGKIEDLATRCNSLKLRYLDSAQNNCNPLIKELRDDFESFKHSRINKNIKTLLD